MTRTRSNDVIDDDVVMREDDADENSVEHPISSTQTAEVGSKPTKRKPDEVRGEQKRNHHSNTLRRISGRKTSSEHTVAGTSL